MSVQQYYETTLLDNHSNLSAHFVSIPSRSYQEKFDERKPEFFTKQLGLNIIGEFGFGNITVNLAYTLTFDNEEKIVDFPGRESQDFYPEDFSQSHIAFAEYLTSANVIPFENSPLSADTFGNIAAKGGSIAIGSTIGFVVAGPTPMLFLTVPAGIIICGAAMGVSRGLQKGLRKRISKFISGK